VLVRGDHAVNEIKLKKALGVPEIELAGPATVEKATEHRSDFAGPVGLKGIRIFADQAIPALKNVVVGGNRLDTHYVDANWGRDFTADQIHDLRNAQAGDPSPKKNGTLKATKGIEVGHVFMLGTKYSQTMNATFLDPQGKECLAVMGCYGIGVGRSAAASIEQNHDERGIIWPYPIAPFHIHLIPVSQSDKTNEMTVRLYAELQSAGFEVLWDDRDDRAGVKFNDADPLVPHSRSSSGQGLAKVSSRKSAGIKTRHPLNSFSISHRALTSTRPRLPAIHTPSTAAGLALTNLPFPCHLIRLGYTHSLERAPRHNRHSQ
jgi:prolyl-tRNA synthetase